MGSTPILKIRYPEPTARVRDGATAMRTMAEDIDAARLDYLDMTNGAGSQPVSNNAWGLCGVGTNAGSRGTGIIPWGSNKGVKVTRAGRFLVTGLAVFDANATGRRGISFCTDPDNPVVNTRRVLQLPLAATSTSPVSFAFQFNLGANAGIGLMLFQDSGSALNATSCMLSVSEI